MESLAIFVLPVAARWPATCCLWGRKPAGGSISFFVDGRACVTHGSERGALTAFDAVLLTYADL